MYKNTIEEELEILKNALPYIDKAVYTDNPGAVASEYKGNLLLATLVNPVKSRETDSFNSCSPQYLFTYAYDLVFIYDAALNEESILANFYIAAKSMKIESATVNTKLNYYSLFGSMPGSNTFRIIKLRVTVEELFNTNCMINVC